MGSLFVVLGVVGVARELPDLWDPCLTWGMNTGSSHLAPDDSCQAKEATSETKAGFLVRLAAVPGFVAACGAVAIVGGVRQRRAWLVGSSIGFAAESIVLFLGLSAAFMVTLGAALLLGLCAALLPKTKAQPPAA